MLKVISKGFKIVPFEYVAVYVKFPQYCGYSWEKDVIPNERDDDAIVYVLSGIEEVVITWFKHSEVMLKMTTVKLTVELAPLAEPISES